MKRIFLYLLIFLLTGLYVFAQNEENAIFEQHEGEIHSSNNKDLEKTTKKQDSLIKKERNEALKKRNKYLKNISKIDKMNEKKRIQERDLNFLKGRLEIKQDKLQNFTEEEKEKGENEE